MIYLIFNILFYRYGLWMILDFYALAPMAIDLLMIKTAMWILLALTFSTNSNELFIYNKYKNIVWEWMISKFFWP